MKLEGCILGQGTKVHAKAELSRCITQSAYEVQHGGQSMYLHVRTLHTCTHFRTESYKNEKLETSDWTAHETSEDQDSDDDSEDPDSGEEESDD